MAPAISSIAALAVWASSSRPLSSSNAIRWASTLSASWATLSRAKGVASAETLGIGFPAERGPGHANLRVLNIRGTGACNSECVFCVEKFNPSHRLMPKTDATRRLIVDAAGRYDMIFFASGEPTIHPKLFEYVDLARSVGFRSFGMSSHFRGFADPRLALRTLQAGFQYFDIALHAADPAAQLEVNPIDDGGASLWEALKGLAVLRRLAHALHVPVSITHKIVVSRLNVDQLEPIFRATYDRGVRHFLVQPVRVGGLDPALRDRIALDEDAMLPRVNALLELAGRTDAVVKPYGFARAGLIEGDHVEIEQNRVKNVYGKLRVPRASDESATTQVVAPTEGPHRVELRLPGRGRYAFPSDEGAPVLDHALRHGVDAPFGCRMGSCGMCCARVVSGRVDMGEQIFLDEAQRARGYVLMCQGRTRTDAVLEACTDDEIDEL